MTLALLTVLVGFFAILIYPFARIEYKGMKAIKTLRAWSKSDCEIVWIKTKALSEKYKDGITVEEHEIPEPMRRAGFRSAFVNASEFRARRGGSAMGGNYGGFVICDFESIGGDGPSIWYSGGRYYPDGTWQKDSNRRTMRGTESQDGVSSEHEFDLEP